MDRSRNVEVADRAVVHAEQTGACEGRLARELHLQAGNRVSVSVEDALECPVGILVGVAAVLGPEADRGPVVVPGQVQIVRQDVVHARFAVSALAVVDDLCQQGEVRRTRDPVGLLFGARAAVERLGHGAVEGPEGRPGAPLRIAVVPCGDDRPHTHGVFAVGLEPRKLVAGLLDDGLECISRLAAGLQLIARGLFDGCPFELQRGFRRGRFDGLGCGELYDVGLVLGAGDGQQQGGCRKNPPEPRYEMLFHFLMRI